MKVLKLLFLITVLTKFQHASPAAETKPDIIVILTDDQRFDAMGFMGHPFLETPHMDRLARDGVHFQNAFVTTSLCSPSRASILTGLYAHNHRVVDNYNPLPVDLVYFPQYLQETGYRTAFVGKWHMGGNIDHPQPGFDHWVSFKGQGVYFPDGVERKVQGRYVPQASNEGFNVNGDRVPQQGYITDELTDYALEWLEDSHRQRKKSAAGANASAATHPSFLFLSHKAVHADFLPANRHAFRYEDKPVPAPETWMDREEKGGEYADVPLWVRNQRNSRHGVEFAYYTDLDMAQYYRRYCETLLAVDESLGRILGWLEKNGRLENTLLLYLGDNGFLFGEHGLIDKRNAYEESIRIPLLAHWPKKIENGTVVPQVVANIDIGPTLLDAAGLEIPDHMDGQSFLPLALGESIPWRDGLLYEYYWERNYPQTPTMHAVRGDRYKYIRYHGIWDIDELYDILEDPSESRNLINSPDHQEIIQDLNQRLFRLLRESDGMELPLVEDRGNKFNLRREDGSRGAKFPPYFYVPPEGSE